MAYYTATPPAQKSAITLDYLRNKADEEYAPYCIDMGSGVLTLVNPIRLSPEKRAVVRDFTEELQGIQKDLEAREERGDDAPEDVEEKVHNLMVSIIAASADNPSLAKELCDQLVADYGLTMTLFQEWMGDDEVGEASSSSNSSTSTETS